MLSSHGGFLTIAMHRHGETILTKHAMMKQRKWLTTQR